MTQMAYAHHWQYRPASRYVTEWTTTARLIARVEAWRALVGRTVEPNPFYEPEFLLASARHIEGRDIRCLAVFRDGARDSDLIGVFPLQRASMFEGAILPAMEFYRNDFVCLTTPLIDREDPAGVWEAFFDSFSNAPDLPRTVLTHLLPARRPAAMALKEVLAKRGLTAAEIERFARPAVEGLVDYDSYAAEFGTKRQKDIRRRARRLAEQGKVAMRTVRDPVEKLAVFDDFLRIEASGWKAEAGTAMACAAHTRALAEEVFMQPSCEFDILTLDGRTIAAVANIVRDGALYSVKTAYDEAYSAFSPGVRLDLWALGNLARDKNRYTRIDSCAIAGHPIGALWREREEIVAQAFAVSETVSSARVENTASLLRSFNRLKGWVKEQIGTKKPAPPAETE